MEQAVDPESGHRFDVLACTHCGLGHTWPTPEHIEDYYSDAYYGQRHSFTASYCAWRRARIVNRATGGGGGSLLDIGCGDGAFVQAASRRGYRAMGTEIGAAARHARALGLDVRESLDEVKEAAPFDVITMWHTLEHFTSPRAVIATVASLLSPRGVLVVAVPNAEGLQARAFGRCWFHLDVPRHLYHFGIRSLSMLLGESGFEIRTWYHQETEYDVFGWLQSGLNAVTKPPNALFRAMTGKPSNLGPAQEACQRLGASAMAPVALAATALGTALHSGGTLVAVARRTGT